MNNSTVLRRLVDLSVDINGLLVPAGSIQRTLARHAFNLIIANDDEDYRVSLVGSATAVRFMDREILLATQHQLNGRDESRVAMITDSGSHVITSGGCRKFIKSSSDTDAYDIVAFDFTEPCADRKELKKRFFNFEIAPPNVLNTEILAVLLIGYPSAEQNYEIHENNHLGIVRRCVVCLPSSQPTDKSLLVLKPLEDLTTDPDGMSGGSAFVIQLFEGHPKAFFAGIIVRGGKSEFYVLKAGYVWAFLRSAFG